MKNFNFIPVASDFLKTEKELENVAGKYFSALNDIGGLRSSKPGTQYPFLIFVITGGTEQKVLNLIENKDGPILLIAHATHNSLPAALEILARLQQDDVPGKIIFLGDPEDKNALNKIVKEVNHLSIIFEMHNSRIGLIGKPSDWLVASTPDFETIKNVWGPEIVEININEIAGNNKEITKSEINEFADSLIAEADDILEPGRNDLEENVRVYLSLKKIINEYRLDALTLRCFDLLTDIKSTGCFGLSKLNDEGIIAGCEGDLVSTVGMLWIYRLLGEMPWMANPAQVDEQKNSILLAHCTVPRTLVRNYKLRSHFESGIGVGIQGYFEEGEVTLLRIGGSNMNKVWTAEGKIVSTPSFENLCRTQAEVKLINSSVSELLTSPLGNHLLMINGKHSQQIQESLELLNLNKINKN